MTSWFKRIQSGGRGSLLDRLILWSGGLLVIAVIGFAIYFLFGQGGDDSADTSSEHDISLAEEAVRGNPEDFGARMVLADAYYRSELYADAAEQYEQALKLEEESLDAMVGLGRALFGAGDLDGAITSFEQVLGIAENEDIPGEFVQTSYYVLGQIALDQDRADDAVGYFGKAVEINRADADAWYMLGVAQVANGDLDEAIASLSRATEFVPDYTEAYQKLLEAYEAKGMDAEVHYALGMLAYSQEDFTKAQDELESAIEVSDDLVVAHVGLGVVLEMQGEKEAAIVAYRRALELEPDNFNARGGLSRLGELEPVDTTTDGAHP